MTWKTRFALSLMMSAVCAVPLFAQTATTTPVPVLPAATNTAVSVEPASTAEPMPTIEHIIVTPQAFPTATDQETVSTVGALKIIHPKDWFSVAGPDGKTLLTNIDLMALPANSQLPENTVLAQIQVFSTSQLPPEMGAVTYATDILQALPTQEGQPTPTISEVEVGGVILGRSDYSKPDNDNILYIRLLDADTFLLATVGSVTPGETIKSDAIFQHALASLEVVMDAPLGEDVARYDSIPQSTSPEGFPQLGSPDAPVKIVEVGSFDCPSCRSFHDLALPVLLERIQAGDVQLTYVPVFGTGSLPRGQRAALAALCVDQQGKFWAYHDALFGWQDFGSLAFLDGRLVNGAKALGLDEAAFTSCLQSLATMPVLNASATFVQSLPEFNGTPTVLLNGESINWSRLPTLIDAALLAATSTEEAGVPAEATADTAAPAATATATTQP